MNARNKTLHIAVALFLAAPGPLAAQSDGSAGERSLRPGTVELGLCGLLSSVDGAIEARLGVRGGTFLEAPLGLWGMEGEASYATVRSLHQVDLEANLAWSPPLGGEGFYPFVALAGGVRLEALGSYRQTLVPLGATVGVRMLATESAGIRFDVKFRRVLNDPVKDFTEINLALGISLFLAP